MTEPWDSVFDPKATEHMEKQIKLAVYCELRNAVDAVRSDPTQPQYYYKGKLVTTPEDKPLPDDWGAQVTLTLTVDESTQLTPGVSFKTPMHDAPVNFKGETITDSPILSAVTFAATKIPQSYAFGLGGNLSSDANRIDTFASYYSMWELGHYNPKEDVCTVPPGPDVMGPDSHSSPFLVSSNLGIKGWLTQAWPAGSFLRSTRKSATGVGPSVSPPGFGPDTISYHIKFTLTSGINATPQWNLVRVSANTNNPLLNVNRMRTHDLLVTIGPGAGPPPVAEVRRTFGFRRSYGPSAEAATIHDAQLIGSAVANALRTVR
jgi:hypothetical protein